MPTVSLERLVVLLVEDNPYLRKLMKQLLVDIGVGRVLATANGEEAIGFLGAGNKALGQVNNIDVVMSDLVMSPINGLLLLRWIRTSKHSPNRFMPFIMVSGAADKPNVHTSRDLGVTEFLAKPLSIKSVSEKLMKVIQAPRAFICTQTYFGPDRRRQELPPPDGVERRNPGEQNATIVYSSDKKVKPKVASDLWIFKLPNHLKTKIGGGARGRFELPENLLEEAESTLERSALDFTKWATDYLNNVSKMLVEAEKDPSKRRGQIAEINNVAHELRGQGGTFGYPLITIFAKSLYETTGENSREDDSAMELIKAHVNTMRAVIRDKISGDGGEVGRQLLTMLRKAIDKHNRTPTK